MEQRRTRARGPASTGNVGPSDVLGVTNAERVGAIVECKAHGRLTTIFGTRPGQENDGFETASDALTPWGGNGQAAMSDTEVILDTNVVS